jgi:hypothetical protein
MYRTAYYPELTMIPSSYTRPSYISATTANTANTNTTHPSPDNVSPIYRCDLFDESNDESNFKTEDELSDHVLAKRK